MKEYAKPYIKVNQETKFEGILLFSGDKPEEKPVEHKPTCPKVLFKYNANLACKTYNCQYYKFVLGAFNDVCGIEYNHG